LEENRLIYWAGFIDGKGTFKIIKRRPNRKTREKTPKYIPYLAVANTNEAIIKLLKKEFGCGTIWHKKPFKPNHKPAFAWYVCDRKCVEIVEKLYPYLIVKKPQAELILKFYNDVGQRMSFGPVCTPNHIIEKREYYYNQMKILNKRGR
jgi:hypothetical protein